MHDLTRIARVTGLFYLALAVSGLFGFLIIRPQLFVAGNPAATLANLTGHEAMARAGVAFELAIVASQALVAVWFYRLFRDVHPVGAASIAAFGLVNAVTVLGSTALLATALELARNTVDSTAATVQVLYLTSENLWAAGALFFGLWLIPMGLCVLRSGRMPRPLGWLLIAGGVGYVLSAFLGFLAPGARPVAAALTYPASAGELWMVLYLLIRGIRRPAPTSPAAEPVPAPGR